MTAAFHVRLKKQLERFSAYKNRTKQDFSVFAEGLGRNNNEIKKKNFLSGTNGFFALSVFCCFRICAKKLKILS